MRKLIGTVFLFGLGMVAMWLAMNFHIVRDDSYWTVISKQDVRFADVYVNIEDWDETEWDRHPQLREALIKAGESHLLPRDEPAGLLRGALDRLGSAAEDAIRQRQ